MPRPTDVAEATSPASAADNLGGEPADRQVAGTILAVEREFIVIDVDGGEARVYASEVMLDVGETPSQRYAVGDIFDAFVFQMEPDPKSGLPQFSIRRAAPYPDALNRLKFGAIVNATVVNTYDVGIELDVDGVRGNAFFDELPLATGESPHDRYQPSEALEQLFVLPVDHDVRGLYLSVRRNAPGYVEALNAHRVGEVVDGVVTDFQGNGGLWLNVDGIIGSVSPRELALADGESAQDRYAIGDTISDLFVLDIDHDARDLSLSARRNTPAYVEALAARSVGEVVSGVVSGFPGNGGLWLDVDGVIGTVWSDDLVHADGQSAQDRYALDDTVHDLFIWHVNRDAREVLLSVRRNTPSYVEALAAHSVGEVVSGVVTNFQDNGGLWLGVDCIIGSVPPHELVLADGQPAQDRYALGDTVSDLFIWQVDHNTRDLDLSMRRNAPGYVEALAAHSVGEVVSAVVIGFQGNGGLWLNVDGVIGGVWPDELALTDGQFAQDRYALGDTVHDLFVWQVNRDVRRLALSVRRNTPGYVDALAAHSSGEVVNGVVTEANEWGVQLDIDGVVGGINLHELVLADGQFPQDRYALGDTVHDLFIWQVDYSTRDLDLSVRRNAPGYVEALNARSVGEVVAGVVTDFQGNGGLWLDVDGVTGSVPPWDLPLADGESTQDRYAVGDTVSDLFVWQVNHDTREVNISMRRNAPAYVEALTAHSVGEVVDGIVTQPTEWGIWLDVADVVGWIPASELVLDEGQSPPDGYPVDQPIEARVWRIDRISRTAILSIRRLDTDLIEGPITLGATVDGIYLDSPPRRHPRARCR